jgi:hypothetical protein
LFDDLLSVLFFLRCAYSKDIHLDLPVTVVHSSALPELPAPQIYPYPPTPPDPMPTSHPIQYLDRVQSPHAYPALPMSPIHPYIDQSHVWLPPPAPQTPHSYPHFSPPIQGQPYYFPPSPSTPIYISPPRPSSVGPSSASHAFSSGLPAAAGPQPLLPLELGAHQPVTPEEGKGERASRITHHLRLSSRHRSVSPQSHRFPLPTSNPVPIPPARTTLQNFPHAAIVTTNISGSSPTLQAVVHSPRPLLSPKQSYAVDPITHNSLPKSERVEELERMAAEVDARNKDLSADIPKAPAESNLNKTLPGPPVPTGKDILLSPPIVTRTRVDTYFAAIPEVEPVPVSVPSEKTPATPMLTAVTPAKLSRPDLLGGLGSSRTESGLDALERRLLAEVGTRKLDLNEKRPDVRSVLPIPIPQPNKGPETLNDSAISSLTLADHDSDGRTHKAGKSSLSGDDREVGQDREKESGKTTALSGREGDRKNGKKKERVKDGEAHRFRKSAKGRVAAWLGGIDPDIPPLDILPSPSPDMVVEPPASSAVEVKAVAPTPGDISDKKDVLSAPNPRSSGFVPIRTLKRDALQRNTALKEAPLSSNVVEKSVTQPWSPSLVVEENSPISSRVSPSWTSHSVEAISPSLPGTDGMGKVPWQALKSSALHQKVAHLSPRLPAFPPPRLDPEVKYDVRSARGGRGGKVAAVASIWASGAIQSKDAQTRALLSTAKTPPSNNTPSTSPEPNLVDFPGKRGRPINKSPSLPAVISSSHAIPTLSSTASLARPTPTPNKVRSPLKVQPTISETDSEVGKAQTTPKVTPAKPALTGDLAFGQARLRDLIKKYQGQTS